MIRAASYESHFSFGGHAVCTVPSRSSRDGEEDSAKDNLDPHDVAMVLNAAAEGNPNVKEDDYCLLERIQEKGGLPS